MADSGEQGEALVCESCEQVPATMERYGGFEWHPICDECAEWWGPHRLRPFPGPQTQAPLLREAEPE